MAENYFAVVVVDHNTDTIKLPEWFTNQYTRAVNTMQNPVWLRTRDIDEWIVQLEILPNGDMWLGEGWKEFAAASAIEGGSVLLFQYVGRSAFDITIYRQGSVGNSHPSHPQGGLPVKFFKRIDNDGCLSQLELPPLVTNLMVDHLPNHLFVNPEDGTKWKVSWKVVNGVIYLYRGWKRAAVHLSIKEDDFLFFSYKGGEDISVLVCKNSESQIIASIHMIIEGEVDMDQQTIWIAKVTEYMLNKQKPLYIPVWVVKKNFANKPEEIDVRLPSGELRKWSFIWCSREKTEGYLGYGWYTFVTEYDLKVNQRVRFYKEWNEDIINVEVLPPISLS